jgi:hypothetical protein
LAGLILAGSFYSNQRPALLFLKMEETGSIVYLQKLSHNFIMNVVDKYSGDARSQL